MVPSGEWQADNGTDFTPYMSGLTLWIHCGARRFEILRQKDIPGVTGKWACFHGNSEPSVSEMAKREPPDSKGVVFHQWGAAPPGKCSS